MSSVDILCDFACHFVPEWGFVPEEGCPVHDVPDGFIPLGDPRLGVLNIDDWIEVDEDA